MSSVLEGSVRKSGNGLRVTAQLINAADGYHLWSQRYDRELANVFAMLDGLAQCLWVANSKLGPISGGFCRDPMFPLEEYEQIS